MIDVKSGKFFYKLVADKKIEHKDTLIQMLRDYNVNETEIAKAKSVDMNAGTEQNVKIQGNRFELNLKVKESEMVFLFGTNLDSDEFSEFTAPYFK